MRHPILRADRSLIFQDHFDFEKKNNDIGTLITCKKCCIRLLSMKKYHSQKFVDSENLITELKIQGKNLINYTAHMFPQTTRHMAPRETRHMAFRKTRHMASRQTRHMASRKTRHMTRDHKTRHKIRHSRRQQT